MQRFIFVLLLAVLSGCGGRSFVHEPVDYVHSPQGAGTILFECSGLEDPSEVIGHYIAIDDRKPIYVEAFSNQRVILEAGRHTLNIVSIGSKDKLSHKKGESPAEDKVYEYGKPVTVSFFMVEGGAAVARYKTPENKEDSGQLWVM